MKANGSFCFVRGFNVKGKRFLQSKVFQFGLALQPLVREFVAMLAQVLSGRQLLFKCFQAVAARKRLFGNKLL